MSLVLSLDPGKTTGLFAYDLRTGEYHASQHGVDETIDILSNYGAGFILVEHYQPVKTSNAGPAEVIGAAKLRAYQLNAEFRRYQPSQTKSLCPNRLLARLFDIPPTLGHARDAARLVVCWALLDAPKDLPIVAQVRAAAMAGSGKEAA